MIQTPVETTKKFEFAETDYMVLLETELAKGIDAIEVKKVEALLATIYRRQADVKNASKEDLFILWKEFKFEHNPLFGEAFAMLLAKKIQNMKIEVDVIFGMPDSASWLLPYLEKYFPNAEFPFCTKEALEGLESFETYTYTKRGPNGERLLTKVYHKPFDVKGKYILLIEDILATGLTTCLALDHFQEKGAEPQRVMTAGVVMMPQGAKGRIEGHPLTLRSYAPVSVSGVSGEGYGRVRTMQQGQYVG
jgi:orotate phosphoribosyltransferase-like protein